MTMKTIEFKIQPNQQQEAKLENWLVGVTWAWNEYLRLVEEFARFQAWDRASKSHVPCCPIGWQYHYEKLDNGKWAYYPYSEIAVGGKGEYFPVCSISQDWRKQLITNTSYEGLSYYFAGKNHPDKPWLNEMSAHVILGTVKLFSRAWTEYKKGNKGKPKYKEEKDRIDTLTNTNTKHLKVVGKHIKIPKLGRFNVKTLDERWHPDTKIVKLVICKRPSGWYLQLCGDVATKIEPPSDIACGIDVGLISIVTDDAGKTVEPPQYYRKAERQMKRLQRQVNRQRSMNGVETGGTRRTRKKIARLHEKIRLQRRNFNHKISTYTVRTFGGIAVEDIDLPKLIRKANLKPKKDGKGYERNKVQSGLNKSFVDAGLGQLLSMMETKSAAHDREFVRVSAYYTTQDCPQCGNRVKKSLSDRIHNCLKCGYEEQRDVAAAINIRAKAKFVRIYRACAREVKRGDLDIVPGRNPEPISVGHGDVVATPSFQIQSEQSPQPILSQKTKRKSRQVDAEVGYQLTLWDVVVED